MMRYWNLSRGVNHASKGGWGGFLDASQNVLFMATFSCKVSFAGAMADTHPAQSQTPRFVADCDTDCQVVCWEDVARIGST